jgi:hypothetical protein
MNTNSAASRGLVYTLLIVVAGAMVAGRIMSAQLVYEPAIHRNETEPADGRRVWPKNRPRPTPLFSSNDRSRWATIRALVEEGTYVVGRREIIDPAKKLYRDAGIIFEDGWTSVDKVMDPATGRFYSSKPTLFPTLVAAEYWLLYHGLGWSLTADLPWVVRTVLLTVNLVPLILYWVVLSRLAERFGQSEWGKLYVVAAGCFGTFLTTFAITLNNHTVAACSALYSLYFGLQCWTPPATSEVRRPITPFLFAGCFGALAAAFELPAMSLLVGLFALLLWRAPWATLAGFVPAAAVVVAAGLLTNYLAIGRLTPAYAELGQKSEWYLYEGSHWRENPGQVKRGIDFAAHQEDRATYIMHFLVGHHGVLTLWPILLLSLAGMGLSLRQLGRERAALTIAGEGEAPAEPIQAAGAGALARQEPRPPVPSNDDPASPPAGGENGFLMAAALTAYLTVVVVGFYLVFTNNYGGWTSGPRWLFWLTPFWLLTMIPAVDRLAACRLGRSAALVVLAVAVAGVSFPAWNPWRHPWLYQFFEALGWPGY